MIVCLVGPSCAGKTTSAEYIHTRLNTAHFEASEFVRSRYSDSSFPGSIIEFVKQEFEKKGKETFARPIRDAISESKDDDIVISGFRTKQEIDLIKHNFNNVFVAGIYANSLLRYQRKLRRDNPDPEYQYGDFIRKDFTEYNFGIVKMLDDEADVLVINEGTFDGLYDMIDQQIVPKVRLG
jgi:dephospho-CoA kinase